MSVLGLKVVGIIQARMKSNRLPEKVMMPIAGKSMLQHVIERVKKANLVDEVVVATTDGIDEDPIAELCKQIEVPYVRGSLHDVLDRYHKAALEFKADVIVRITSDCPLIDPMLIDETVQVLSGGDGISARWIAQSDTAKSMSELLWDYASTRLPPPWKRTFPIGLDVESVTIQALEYAWQNADQSHQREHVMPYFYEEPGRFKVIVAECSQNFGHFRWTVDTEADLNAVRKIVDYIGEQGSTSWLDVLKIVQSHPEINEINAYIHHKDYRETDHRNDIR